MFKLNKELVNGSIILLIAFNIFNFLNFIFQFIMARLMSPEEYGTLAALFSIVYVSGMFSDSIQTIVTKYSSKEKDKGKLKNLFKRMYRKTLIMSVVLFILFLIGAIVLANIWETRYILIAITGLVIFPSILSPISRGIMQGRKRFSSLGGNLISEAGIKIFLTSLLVILGLSVFGVVIGLVIAMGLAFFISTFQIKDILKSKEKNMALSSIYQQSILIFIFTLALTLFYSLDVIIAKAVFSPEIAGYYAIASILGKIAFWGTQPISRAMLPIASEKTEISLKNKKLKHVFRSSLLILTLGLLAVLVVFYEFPELIIRLFSGKDLIFASQILFRTGLAMAILAYSNLLLYYKIATSSQEKNIANNQTKSLVYKALFFVFIIIFEFVILYNSKTDLISFSNGLILSAIIFLIGSFVIFYHKK
ncbi:MAG: oligosaccharide flippase family protein [Nanoarchaeota archaeon]